MSDITNILNGNNQQINNVDISKIFIGENQYEAAIYTNSSYVTVELLEGTLMGKIATTQEVIPLLSSATDGSQFPIGILAKNYTVLAGEAPVVTYCTAGYVVKEKVILNGSDLLTTVISSRSINDRIGSDTVGIVMFASDEQTQFDNQ